MKHRQKCGVPVVSPLVSSQLSAVFSKMWKSRRARELAWRQASDSITAKQDASFMYVLGGYEVAIQGAFGGEITAEQEAEVWNVVEYIYQQRTETPNIDSRVMLATALTWKGTTNIFGWDGIASSLPNETRYRAAYALAHRMLKLNKRDDAVRFLKTVVKDAPAGSKLSELSQRELDELNK